MGAGYRTSVPQFVEDFMYTPPWEAAQKAIAINDAGINQSLATAQLFNNIDVQHIPDEDIKNRVKEITGGYEKVADDIVTEMQTGMQSNVGSWRQSMPKLTKLAQDLQKNMKTGELAAYQNSAAAYKNMFDTNKEVIEKNPYYFQLGLREANRKYKEAWAKDKTAIWKAEDLPFYDISSDKELQTALKDFGKKFATYKNGNYFMDGKMVTRDEVQNYLVGRLYSNPKALSYMRKAIELKDPNFVDSEGKIIPLMKTYAKDGKGNYIEITPEKYNIEKDAYDKLSPQEKNKVPRFEDTYSSVINNDNYFGRFINAEGIRNSKSEFKRVFDENVKIQNENAQKAADRALRWKTTLYEGNNKLELEKLRQQGAMDLAEFKSSFGDGSSGSGNKKDKNNSTRSYVKVGTQGPMDYNTVLNSGDYFDKHSASKSIINANILKYVRNIEKDKGLNIGNMSDEAILSKINVKDDGTIEFFDKGLENWFKPNFLFTDKEKLNFSNIDVLSKLSLSTLQGKDRKTAIDTAVDAAYKERYSKELREKEAIENAKKTGKPLGAYTQKRYSDLVYELNKAKVDMGKSANNFINTYDNYAKNRGVQTEEYQTTTVNQNLVDELLKNTGEQFKVVPIQNSNGVATDYITMSGSVQPSDQMTRIKHKGTYGFISKDGNWLIYPEHSNIKSSVYNNQQYYFSGKDFIKDTKQREQINNLFKYDTASQVSNTMDNGRKVFKEGSLQTNTFNYNFPDGSNALFVQVAQPFKSVDGEEIKPGFYSYSDSGYKFIAPNKEEFINTVHHISGNISDIAAKENLKDYELLMNGKTLRSLTPKN